MSVFLFKLEENTNVEENKIQTAIGKLNLRTSFLSCEVYNFSCRLIPSKTWLESLFFLGRKDPLRRESIKLPCVSTSKFDSNVLSLVLTATK